MPDAAPGTPTAIQVSGLARTFSAGTGPLSALREVSLEVFEGEFVCVIGPSGCGKTTLLRILGGLDEPSDGKVLLRGRSPSAAQASRSIGYVFQDPGLLPWRDVAGNIRLPLEVTSGDGRAADEAIFELVALVGLAGFEDFYPARLSRGMQQRVALARALALDPPLLFMDEPFSALDEITRARMRYELLRIWEQWRKTVVFVTHSIAEAVALGDRVVVLSERPGRVLRIVDVPFARPRMAELERTAQFFDLTNELRSLLSPGL
ncbi:MAG: ABC transporter ATP-binding protein [Chloroflexota bacterium]